MVQRNERILAQKTITVDAKTGLVEIYVQDNSARELELVTVTAPTQASRLQKSPENITVIDTKPFYKTNQTALDVIRQTSGIKVRTSGGYGAQTNFYINGISGKQIKFFLDGVPTSALGETQGINLIPLEQTARFEIYKGVIPIGFGSDALGGAINMVSRNERNDFIDVSSAIGSFKTTKNNLNVRKFLTDHFYVGLSATYNYSKNDYSVMAEVPDVYGIPSVKNVRRFHNAFRFYNAKVQAGWINTKWADQLSLTGQLSHTYDQIQNNVIMRQPYGQAYNQDDLAGGVVQYSKRELIKNVQLNAYASLYSVKGFFADTTLSVYNWEGDVVDRRATGGEISAAGNLLSTKSLVFNTQQSIGWTPRKNLTLSLSNTYQQFYRKGSDPFSLNFYSFDFYANPQTMRKNISGASMASTLLGGKVQSVVSLKHFSSVSAGNLLVNDVSVPVHQSVSKLGYNAAFTYFFGEEFFLKASYEKATRLPDQTEAFGDLMLLKPNPGLIPEQSHNANVNLVVNSQYVDVEASGFYRNIDNIIYLRTSQFSSQYQNLLKARITGAELSVRIKPHRTIKFASNITFQDIRNQSVLENAGINNDRYMGARLPNIPYLFANGGLTVNKENVLNKSGQLQAYWNCNYTHSYYLYWAVDGDQALKNVIPMQLVNQAGLSFSHDKSGLSLSADVNNLFDTVLYDNFKVQLPGRNYSLKLRFYTSKNRSQ
ncbi:TonB-dependent receptor domain-containing protein [Spirosoma utsteinense]|uniref:Outer membrane cobalamin receptor n=1 Tax=Spirosoma utsteinense TaxID=2585773 RepID=A0ABR6WG27_9BACT|nr:TonB-dependent receptor [Spirosoma utsteinense]MBC3789196.1 outer membrane cobalamin receptor [Spirosoma utsteinense]MBC3794950.1 outer membrane cobalamin receptor [Spirosoma utsteinense]